MNVSTKFALGHVVKHARLGYRGVVLDIDASYDPAISWGDGQPSGVDGQPYYRILVHGKADEAYVAEQDLEADTSGEPIDHPLIDELFAGMKDGCYVRSVALN